MSPWQQRDSEPNTPRRPVVWALDDSPMQGALAATVLSRQFEVRLFSEGGVLLEALMLGQPEALVLDWHLADMSGLDVLRAIRLSHDEVTLPVLILTGSAQPKADMLEALDAGANDFATKPFIEAELIARVSTLVRVRVLHERARQAEHAHEQARIELQARADFEQQLIGIVSHDLRTPVNALALGAGLLEADSTLAPKHAVVVDRLVASAGRASRMVADLLDFTAVRLGQGLPMNPARVDLHPLVRQVLAEVAIAHSGRKIHLHQAGSAVGFWDADRISQVIANLVTNAMHYSPQNTDVEVVTGCSERWAVLKVRNAGDPIPEALMARLFLPMERGKPNLEASRRSVGLGLYIVDNIVRAHRGTIDVQSNAATGTLFTVHLPRMMESHEAHELAAGPIDP